jgi:hypothetical protein
LDVAVASATPSASIASCSTRLLRHLLVAASFLIAYAPGCGDSAGGAAPGIVYAGAATDEGLDTFLAAPARVDPSRGPALTSPANGATIAGASPTRLTGADLTGARLLQANLEGAIVEGATTDATTTCPTGAMGPCW